MRRILFGGLGLALGVFVTPAAGQDARKATPTPSSAQQRVARLGIPTAIPDPSAADSGIRPVALLGGQVVTPIPSPMPPPTSGKPVGMPTPGIPTMGVPMPGPPVPVPGLGLGSGPSIVEDRGQTGTPNMLGDPTLLSGVPTVVPSVGPDGIVTGPWGMETPNPVDCPTGMPATGRVAGCGRWLVSGEYLMWWSRAADLPPLATTSSLPNNGILGLGDTRILSGGTPFGQTFHSGMRFSAVRWFGDGQCSGLDARIFFLGQAGSSFTATTGQYPLLARPFFNINPGTPFYGSDSEIVARTGLADGGVNVKLQNSMWGAEANYRQYLFGNANARVDALIGYRYLNMTEQLTITENFLRTPGSIDTTTTTGIPAVSGTVFDQFRTVNNFNGGQIGLVGDWHRGRWSLDARATVAFGNLTRTAVINGGQTLVMPNGMVAAYQGGLLTVPGGNIGRFSDNVFTVAPEVGLNLGYQATQRLRFFVGYNFLYLGNALRPGNVIDTAIDPTRIPNFPLPGNPASLPGLIHPTPQFRSAGFFVQGISFGLSFTW